ncbi:MAG: hypothetical protein ACTSXX_01715 [Candidatus Baldrarchaeia archaeon]
MDVVFMDSRYYEEKVKLIDKYRDVKLSFADSFTVVLRDREKNIWRLMTRVLFSHLEFVL